jgi:hypothetical protein
MKELLLTFLLAQGADMATTHAALSRGCVEMNPILGKTPASMYAVKGSTTVAVSYVVWKAEKAKQHKAVKVILLSGIAAAGTAALLNARAIPRCG